ncbi:MAG: TetR/AcrR family transcriptional regulator [Streptosporangiales bacterium]|nr:TetR/AcrR family transcriptional regulator [Streptosporangiales bacterium]MBO0892489.1 TetR/AcrR family transcriptional regulator [Acidothermales bacterium]
MAAVDRPMRADARRNHDRLLQVAKEAFTEHGYRASLDDIARRAGVGSGTLYRHFPDRDALLATVYREDVDALAARADALAEQYPPGEALAAWMHEQLAYVREMHGLGSAVKAMLGVDSETFNFCKDTMRGAVQRLLEPAQRAGEIRPDVTPADVMRLVHGVGTAVEKAPEEADRLLSFVIDGLRPQPD